jgi:16S rRNA (cytosine967-C5)-methyltransferase
MGQASARAIAQNALREWRAGDKFADTIIRHHLAASQLRDADRAFTTELFYGILRNLSVLDLWISLLRSDPLDDDTRDLLRLGLYQVLLLRTPEHAAVYETVALGTKRNRTVVNGVLRNALRRRSALENEAAFQDLAVRKSHPRFLVERWQQNMGRAETESLCDWNNRPAAVYARINRLKTSRDDFISNHPEAELMEDDFVRLQRIPHDALAAGECYIQDPSTTAACRLLDPRPGERVLDACAAPGGKAALLAQLMKNKGMIVACDRDSSRVQTLQANLDRLGVEIAQLHRHDWIDGIPFPEAGFDRILIDAPCSNTGVMRRRVDVRWRLRPEDFSRMPDQQIRIARAVIPLLRPGGILVYSTCSIEPEENQHVVAGIVRELPFLKLAEQISLFPFKDQCDGAYAAKLIRQ